MKNACVKSMFAQLICYNTLYILGFFFCFLFCFFFNVGVTHVLVVYFFIIFFLYLGDYNNCVFRHTPGKHAGSYSHLVWISWEALARSGPDDSCTLACFQTGSVRPKPDTIRTKSNPSWFHTILFGTSVEELY